MSEAPSGLFDPERLLIAPDAEGGIVYQPRFVDAATAQRWFEAIRAEAPWRTQRRRMYDRDVDVPRLMASYALDRERVPAAVAEAARRVRAALGAPFDSVGLNFYRDGRDSVAPHNDHLYEIAPGQPIALLSLGHPRRMDLKRKARGSRAIVLQLEPGSLLTMSHASQHEWLHGIPKTKEPVGERISLAFRVRPPVPA
ncbi:MAG TPA: alpha-ketoglutarate-dependent dioxygenase AlkB [Candidatus Binatia bacterium]|nr:alpha-ketoglutarate-dependent dioxygenase AlkB [Candidatus Binatia bacterium]